jgi:Sulfotransferase family
MFRHLHIVACSPRSGTTLLHEAMVTCFRVDRHYDHEIRFNRVAAADGQVVITKRPKDTMYMPGVIDEDPELYVIYLLRDPRDVIVSRHGKDDSLYYSNIRLWRQMHACAKKMFGHERFLVLRYEDFVRDPDGAQAKILEKFPWLERMHAFSEYHEHARVSQKSATAMHGVRPIAPTSVGVWTRYPGRIKAQQLQHGSLSPELIECGYEASADWERVLDGVEPDFSKSLYPEKLRFWRRWAQQLDARRKIAKYRRMRRRSPAGERR